MAPRYDEAPEAIPHNYPEVHHPPSHPEATSPSPFFKPDQNGLYSAYPSSPAFSPAGAPSSAYGYDQLSGYGTGTLSTNEKSKPKRTICGCQVIVFILSIIIAILSAAVIGLAAGTGIASSKASNAESQVATLNVALNQSTAPPTIDADYSKIDRNCSSNPGGVSGSTYKATFFSNQMFEVHCNSETPPAPVLNLFVANFDDCMDACASWSISTPGDFPGGNSTKTRCMGVSFIPFWTNRINAQAGHAPGNCYLKPGPLNRTTLTTPNIGGAAVHAAVLLS